MLNSIVTVAYRVAVRGILMPSDSAACLHKHCPSDVLYLPKLFLELD